MRLLVLGNVFISRKKSKRKTNQPAAVAIKFRLMNTVHRDVT